MPYPPPPFTAPERPTTPPWRKMVQDLPEPSQKVGFYTELVNRDDPGYQQVWPIERGTPYSNILGAEQRVIDAYADNPLYFLKQLRPGSTSSSDFGSSDLAVLWVWATNSLAQNSYNSEVTYEAEGVSYPGFQRVSTVRRKDWEANPTLTPLVALTGLLSVAITAPGTGYTYATGTTATGAEATAVVLRGAGNVGGPIIDWIVTKEGTGVTGGASLTIVGDGTGATAVARIQPASAVLVSQKKQELAEGDPYSNDYVQIVRIYATLPGPTLTEVKINPETRAEVTISKTRKVTTDITPGVEIVTVGMDTFVKVTSRETIDLQTSYEVITLQELPAAHSFATSIQETSYPPFQFPATLDLVLYVATLGVIGYTEPFTRKVKHQSFTWWEASLTTPDITTLMEDLTASGGVPKLGYIFAAFRNGGSIALNTLSELVYNPVTLDYGGGIIIDWAGSDPDFTTYLANWTQDASAPRNVMGSVSAGNYYLWKIEIIQVKFLMEIGGTIVP